MYIENCISPLDTSVNAFKQKIGYSLSNPNPLELPNYCNIVFIDANGSTIGKYDYLFNDLTHATVDTNRNAIVFIDKTRESICPVMLVKSSGNGHLPAIVENTFHANVIGRWK